MILEKDNAVIENRKLMGATDPQKAEEGTIRKMYGVSIDKILYMDQIVLKMQKLKLIFSLSSR